MIYDGLNAETHGEVLIIRRDVNRSAECFELTKTSVTANRARRPQICNSLQHAGLIGYV